MKMMKKNLVRITARPDTAAFVCICGELPVPERCPLGDRAQSCRLDL